jgi:hypothetical protein
MEGKLPGYIELTHHKTRASRRAKNKRLHMRGKPSSSVKEWKPTVPTPAAPTGLGGERLHGLIGGGGACLLCGLPYQSPAHKRRLEES